MRAKILFTLGVLGLTQEPDLKVGGARSISCDGGVAAKCSGGEVIVLLVGSLPVPSLRGQMLVCFRHGSLSDSHAGTGIPSSSSFFTIASFSAWASFGSDYPWLDEAVPPICRETLSRDSVASFCRLHRFCLSHAGSGFPSFSSLSIIASLRPCPVSNESVPPIDS